MTTSTSGDVAAVNRILADSAATRRHLEAIAAAAAATKAAGVHLDYAAVDPGRRQAFSQFVVQLATKLRADGRGLVVTVPAQPEHEPGAYDWTALAAAADGLWLRPPADPATYYEQVEAALRGRRDSDVDLSKVSLVVDRRSRERTSDGVRTLSLHEALTAASSVRTRLEQGIVVGDAVTLSGANIDQEAGNSGLRWDERARAVAFTYAGRTGPRSVWIENRFSVAFRLDLARRYGLGVVVEAAAKDGALPDIWPVVAAYVEEAHVRLELPYGPYLLPRWLSSDGQFEGSGDRGTAVWRAPARPGVYDVTLVVSDGVVFVGQQLSLRVTVATPTPTATLAPAPTATPAPAATAQGTVAPTSTAVATPRPATATSSPTATSTPRPTATATVPGPTAN